MTASFSSQGCIISAVLLLTAQSAAMDSPPDLMWDREFGDITGCFYDVEALQDGNMAVCGFYHLNSKSWALVHKLSSTDGATIWTWVASDLDTSIINEIEELPDGRIAAAGGILPMQGFYRFAVVAILAENGQELSKWVYDLGEDATADCLEPMQDGGFAVGGILSLSKSSMPFVLRIGPAGSLVWQTMLFTTSGCARSIELDSEGNLLVYVTPEEGPPVIACLDPADGDSLWSVDYTGTLPGSTGDMSRLPSTGGLALASGGFGAAAALDGRIDWVYYLPGYNTRKLLSVAPVMGGGIIFSGGDHYIPWSPEPPSNPHPYNGWLVRTDNQGNVQWMIDLDNGHEVCYTAARQLAQGGYCVSAWISGAGGCMKAYALAFEPELGFGGEPFEPADLRASPNPFSASIEIEWSQEVPGMMSIEAFDVSGRLSCRICDSYCQPGMNSATWSPVGDLPAGIYLLVARSVSGTATIPVVLLR